MSYSKFNAGGRGGGCNGQACHLGEGGGEWKYSESLPATQNGDKPWPDGLIGSNINLTLCTENFINEIMLKGAQSRLNGLKSLAKLFNFVVFQSVSIFSILNHPCSFTVCYNLFGVFLSLQSIIFRFPSI